MIQAKAEADERIALAEKKIKELSKAIIFNNDKQCLSNIIIMTILKAIHARKILLDENTDKLLRNTSLAKKKEVTVQWTMFSLTKYEML